MSRDWTFVDVNGLGGGLSLGLARAGGQMVGRTGSLALGQKIVWANRSHFGREWVDAIDKKADGRPLDWPIEFARGVDVVAAVPPCSGFSNFTGLGSAVPNVERAHAGHKSNGCMIDTVAYASRLAPRMVVFESVTGAYTKGRELMQALRDNLEAQTGRRYWLTHVLHNGVSLGAPASRKRYLFIATRGRPFTLAYEPTVDEVTTVQQVFGDLVQMKSVPGMQRYRGTRCSEYAARLRSPDGQTDGMWHRAGGGWFKVIEATLEACDSIGDPWEEGGYMQRVLARLGAADPALLDQVLGPRLAERLAARRANVLNQEYGDTGEAALFGPFVPVRWNRRWTARVVTGGGPQYAIHPTENRNLHYRELARTMGYPDTWLIDTEEVKGEKLDAVWGKNVHVMVGEWLGKNIEAWLAGDVGRDGEIVGDGEFLFDDLAHGLRLMRELKARQKTREAA